MAPPRHPPSLPDAAAKAFLSLRQRVHRPQDNGTVHERPLRPVPSAPTLLPRTTAGSTP